MIRCSIATLVGNEYIMTPVESTVFAGFIGRISTSPLFEEEESIEEGDFIIFYQTIYYIGEKIVGIKTDNKYKSELPLSSFEKEKECI